MTNKEIYKHERYKQMSLFSYDVQNNKLPEGSSLLGIIENPDNGFYAAVIKNENEIVISIRGTEGELLKSKENWKDIQNDISMLNQFPEQGYSALEAVDIVKEMIKNDPAYFGYAITVIGHSLGGSLAQIVSAIKRVKAVTFNAYGTKHLLQNIKNLDSVDVTNYCNADDNITTLNAKNHIGKCYDIGTNYVEGKGPHHLECMENLENRIPVTTEYLQHTGERKRQRKMETEFYKRTGKHMPIRMPSVGFHGENCAGTYTVNGYTREDGTKVASYTRTCGAKHLNQQHVREKYKGRSFDSLSDVEVKEFLDVFI